MDVLIIIATYLMGAGIVFPIMGNKLCPDDYWEHPGPFFSAVGWPVVVPLLIGTAISNLVFVGEGHTSRADRRRDKELDEARHKLEVAKINAETTRQLEQALHE